MTEFYSARSRIVHGQVLGEEGAAEAFDSGFGVALRTLQAVAFEGVPADSQDWDRLVVAGGKGGALEESRASSLTQPPGARRTGLAPTPAE